MHMTAAVTDLNDHPLVVLIQQLVTKLYSDAESLEALWVAARDSSSNSNRGHSGKRNSDSDNNNNNWQHQLFTALTTTSNVSWQKIAADQLNQQKFARQAPLSVIVVDQDPQTYDAIRQSIQRCRDLFARHTLILTPAHSDLTVVEFGFSRLANHPIAMGGHAVDVWQFNLFDYKQLPDWLNSKFWANPENWDKFRW